MQIGGKFTGSAGRGTKADESSTGRFWVEGFRHVRVQLKCDGTRWRREGKWRGNWRMEWVANTLLTTSQHGVSSNTNITTAYSAASSRLNWRPLRFKWARPFRRKTKSGFCACAITFQTQPTVRYRLARVLKLKNRLFLQFSNFFFGPR